MSTSNNHEASNTLFSFFVIDEGGILQVETLLIDSDLERLIEQVQKRLNKQLFENGYHAGDLPELMTDDGYCNRMVRDRGA